MFGTPVLVNSIGAPYTSAHTYMFSIPTQLIPESQA